MWLVHHAIGDQWSASIVARELRELYQAAVSKTPAELPPLPIQYADFAAWQREHLGGSALDTQLAYWRDKLRGLAPVLLPTDRPRPRQQTFRGAYVVATMSPLLRTELKRFCTATGVTPFMTLLACFQMLLARYVGHTDIAVGTPIANRTRLATEHLVGTLVNMLVMRNDTSEDPFFGDFLKQVKETALDAYAHQDLPFERLVEEFVGTRDQGHAPLVQVLLNVPNAPLGIFDIKDIELERFDFDSGSAQFDVALTVDTERRGRVYLTYASDLFDENTATAMLARFVMLLEQVLADPTRRLSGYSFTTDSERQQIVEQWNATVRSYPNERRADELIAARAADAAHAVAVVDGTHVLSYAQLNERANRLARYLRRRGVGRNSTVGIALERSADLVVALLGVMRSGGAYVPLDPGFPSERLEFMARDAGLTAVLTSNAVAGTLPQMPGTAINLDEHTKAIENEDADELESLSGPDDLAYVLYTSGSTGRPKGVETPHRALTNFLCSMQQSPGCTERDTLLAVTTLSFDIAGLEIFLPLLVGAKLVIASRAAASDGQELKELIRKNRPTLMQATPVTWRMLIAAGWRGNRRLRILCGGEALPQDLAEQLLKRCGELWNLYGPTETTIWSTIEHIASSNPPISIGRPIANTTAFVLDAALQPLPPGIPGELFIGGDGLARGYRNQLDLTSERFVESAFVPGQRLYRTGDLATYLPDGRLQVQGLSNRTGRDRSTLDPARCRRIGRCHGMR
jgi:amino acid adenylation domain-containing protein